MKYASNILKREEYILLIFLSGPVGLLPVPQSDNSKLMVGARHELPFFMSKKVVVLVTG